MSTDQYNNVQASLFSFCNTLISSYKPSISDTLSIEKLDAFADPSKLPEHDIVGPMHFQMSVYEGLLEVETMIVFSTVNDRNLFRLDEMIGKTFERLLPGSTIPLVRASDGTKIGQFTLKNGTSVLPVDNSANRPVKAIAIQLALDLAMTP